MTGMDTVTHVAVVKHVAVLGVDADWFPEPEKASEEKEQENGQLD